jgi:hypothetical protein
MMHFCVSISEQRSCTRTIAMETETSHPHYKGMSIDSAKFGWHIATGAKP